MIITPKIKGFICITAHPEGCAQHVQEQIDFVKSQPAVTNGPKKVLIIGSSTGYGLASRITAAFGSKTATLGVFFERPSTNGKPASAGWYNAVALDEKARAEGLYSKSINGDAFSNEIKQQVIDTIKKDLGQVDMVIYSLASPRRTDPFTGEVYKSVLKPTGAPFTGKTVDTDKKTVFDVTIEPATQEEILQTEKVMGGEDWELWIKALLNAGVLAPNATTVAYSYIGPKATWAIYHKGTIGNAKNHLDATAKKLQKELAPLNGRAFVSVNKAVVTQASSAIPVVPLYIVCLFRVMKQLGLHEGCIEQCYRLLKERLYDGANLQLDEEGRIRVDDLEMRNDVQSATSKLMEQVNTENLEVITDFNGYQDEFLKLFGFGVKGVDYGQDTMVERDLPN